MIRYLLRRLLYMIPILFGITLLTFTLFHLAGGDPAVQIAGRYATPERIAEIRAQLGLDRPVLFQYLIFVKQVLSFDFGSSLTTKQAVSTMILSGLGPSASLGLPAFFITLFVTVTTALFLVYRRGSPWGGVVDKMVMVFCLAAMSISSLVYILALQYWLGYRMDWFPIAGWESGWLERWQYLALPIIIFVTLSLGSNILFFRTVFLDELFQDYVRTARAKGLAARTVMFKHILRNALIPIVTVTVLEIPFLILGSLLIEAFFGIPGIGGLIYQAIQNSDFPVIRAMTVFSAILYMAFQLLTDALYAVVDPRVRLG